MAKLQAQLDTILRQKHLRCRTSRGYRGMDCAKERDPGKLCYSLFCPDCGEDW